MQMLTVPGTFPDFICCIACVTSYSVGTLVAISKSSFGVGRSSVIVAAFLVKPSENVRQISWFGFPLFSYDFFFVLNNTCTCLGVSAELISQLIYCTQFSLSLQ